MVFERTGWWPARCGRTIALCAIFAWVPAFGVYPAGAQPLDRGPGLPRPGGCSAVAHDTSPEFLVVCSTGGGPPRAIALAVGGKTGLPVPIADRAGLAFDGVVFPGADDPAGGVTVAWLDESGRLDVGRLENETWQGRTILVAGDAGGPGPRLSRDATSASLGLVYSRGDGRPYFRALGERTQQTVIGDLPLAPAETGHAVAHVAGLWTLAWIEAEELGVMALDGAGAVRWSGASEHLGGVALGPFGAADDATDRLALAWFDESARLHGRLFDARSGRELRTAVSGSGRDGSYAVEASLVLDGSSRAYLVAWVERHDDGAAELRLLRLDDSLQPFGDPDGQLVAQATEPTTLAAPSLACVPARPGAEAGDCLLVWQQGTEVETEALALQVRVPIYGPPPDEDGDGVADNADNCPMTFNPEQQDFDRDEVGDACDDDDDGDGVDDALDCQPLDENIRDVPAALGPTVLADPGGTFTWDAEPDAELYNLYQGTVDGAWYDHACLELQLSLPIYADPRTPLSGRTYYYLVSKRNCFGEGPLGDDAEGLPRPAGQCADGDGDGVTDNLDNCPMTANADQRNSDNDIEGDACDADDDNDGLSDDDEEIYGTDPLDPDSDDDALSDFDEIFVWGSDPLTEDTDGDNVNDGADNCPITVNPSQANADGDGLGDSCDRRLESASLGMGCGSSSGLAYELHEISGGQNAAGLLLGADSTIEAGAVTGSP